jgi:hypothetical protein
MTPKTVHTLETAKKAIDYAPLEVLEKSEIKNNSDKDEYTQNNTYSNHRFFQQI